MEKVTNNMLYELIINLKNEMNMKFEQVDQRFEQIDRRFELVDKQLGYLNGQMAGIKQEMKDMQMEQREYKTKLNEVYESRRSVAITFSRAFVGVNLVLSALVSGIVSLFVSSR